MENCAFIKTLTTGNDLYGQNNCPIQFGCQIFSNDEIFDVEKFFHSIGRNKVMNIIPDEDIMPQGYLSSGIWDQSENGEPLKESLEKIYNILSTIRKNGIYLIGYSHIDFDMKILNSHFKRILDKEPIEFDKKYVIDIMKFAEAFVPVEKVGNYSMDSVFVHLVGNSSILDSARENKGVEREIHVEKMIFEQLIHRYWKDPKSTKFSDIVEKIELTFKNSGAINFGKYKGLTVTEVFGMDKQYCSWMMNNKTFQVQHPNLVEAIQKKFNEVE